MGEDVGEKQGKESRARFVGMVWEGQQEKGKGKRGVGRKELGWGNMKCKWGLGRYARKQGGRIRSNLGLQEYERRGRGIGEGSVGEGHQWGVG